jgi:hypothetical protein
MKKMILIAAVILLPVIGATAQSPRQFGIKGGVNMASEGTDEGSTDFRVGIHVGFFVETQIGRMVDFQPELLYSMQGGESDGLQEKLDYITVPLMFKFYTGQARRFSIDAGPQLGYMVSAKVAADGGSLSLYDYDGLNKLDASLAVGVTYKFDGGFDLGARFVYGATKIWDSLEHRNGVIQMGVGYRF